MKKISLFLVLTVCLTVASLPALADFNQISQPTAAYTSSTTLYTPSVGNGNSFSSVGPFSFSSALTQETVPSGWATWSCPPASESCNPVVGWTTGATSLTISLSSPAHTVGFELEPDMFQQEEVTAAFWSGGTLVGTLDLFPNGSAGALLYAASSSSYSFDTVVVNDLSGDDFAIANLRAGAAVGTPEPGTLALLGSAFLGLAGFRRKK